MPDPANQEPGPGPNVCSICLRRLPPCSCGSPTCYETAHWQHNCVSFGELAVYWTFGLLLGALVAYPFVYALLLLLKG